MWSKANIGYNQYFLIDTKRCDIVQKKYRLHTTCPCNFSTIMIYVFSFIWASYIFYIFVYFHIYFLYCAQFGEKTMILQTAKTENNIFESLNSANPVLMRHIYNSTKILHCQHTVASTEAIFSYSEVYFFQKT